ncbi:MAG: type II secretion system protein GspD, partial [Sporomusa sp.]
IRINPEYNSITVDGTPGIIHKAEDVIAKLDQPVEQIFIMAQMIEVNRKDSLKLGFQYTLPGYDNSAQPFRAQFTVTSAGERSFDNGTVLARPAVTTFNGLEATLHMGDQVPVIKSNTATTGTVESNVTFEEVGAKLKVTPFVNDKEKKIITLTLEPSISSVVKWITSGSVTAPQISTRTAKTKVRVKSGDNIVIGGLMRQADIENLKGIPGLMKLPILGKLFQYKEKSKEQTEVFFIVTPYLLDDDTTLENFQKMLRQEEPKEISGILKKKAKKSEPQPIVISEQE